MQHLCWAKRRSAKLDLEDSIGIRTDTRQQRGNCAALQLLTIAEVPLEAATSRSYFSLSAPPSLVHFSEERFLRDCFSQHAALHNCLMGAEFTRTFRSIRNMLQHAAIKVHEPPHIDQTLSPSILHFHLILLRDSKNCKAL